MPGLPDRLFRLKFKHLSVITLTVNGSEHSVEPGSTVTVLLERLALTGKRIAVERNGEIVPRSQYAQTPLQQGDQLEIVVAVGGG